MPLKVHRGAVTLNVMKSNTAANLCQIHIKYVTFFKCSLWCMCVQLHYGYYKGSYALIIWNPGPTYTHTLPQINNIIPLKALKGSIAGLLYHIANNYIISSKKKKALSCAAMRQFIGYTVFSPAVNIKLSLTSVLKHS